MAYEIDLYTERARTVLADGPKSCEQLVARGISLSAQKVLRRNGVIRPKMRPWLNHEGRVIGAIEEFCLAPPPAPRLA